MADFVESTVAHATDLNTLLKLFARTGSGVYGTPPAASTMAGFKVQAGTSVGTTNGSGDLNISWPTAFPTGVLVVIAQGGTAPQHVAVYGDPAGTSPPSTTQFSVRVYASPGGAALASTSVRITWFAIGW